MTELSKDDVKRAEQTILSLLDLRQIDSFYGAQIIFDLIEEVRAEGEKEAEELAEGLFEDIERLTAENERLTSSLASAHEALEAIDKLRSGDGSQIDYIVGCYFSAAKEEVKE